MTEHTDVELLWIEGRIERWIRFGNVIEERLVDRRRRIVSFAPNSVFAFVRWASNDYGTLVSRIDIVRACRAGEHRSTVPGITPAGTSCCGFPAGRRSKRCLKQSMPLRRSACEPKTSAPTIGGKSTAACPPVETPERYTRQRHRAWLLRREMARLKLGIALTGLSATALLSTALLDVPPILVWNASPSVPVGLYAVLPIGTPKLGDLVLVEPPTELAGYLSRRGYLV